MCNALSLGLKLSFKAGEQKTNLTAFSYRAISKVFVTFPFGLYTSVLIHCMFFSAVQTALNSETGFGMIGRTPIMVRKCSFVLTDKWKLDQGEGTAKVLSCDFRNNQCTMFLLSIRWLLGFCLSHFIIVGSCSQFASSGFNYFCICIIYA